MFALVESGSITKFFSGNRGITIGNNQYPKEIVPFEITEHDIADIEFRRGGDMLVEFEITESGHVENPVVIDSFNTYFNIVVLDKVRQSRYTPATQNGRPVRVKYRLPIKVKR